jgi:hypothetical protein
LAVANLVHFAALLLGVIAPKDKDDIVQVLADPGHNGVGPFLPTLAEGRGRETLTE